jgi:hypothetical protein
MPKESDATRRDSSHHRPLVLTDGSKLAELLDAVAESAF